MATTQAPDGEKPVPAHRGGQSGRQAHGDYSLRQAELQFLLERIDEQLGKCGLVPRRERMHARTDTAPPVELALEDEQRTRSQRRQAKEIASMMFSHLETRLDTLTDTFARLSEQERLSLAALLRLPEPRRNAIATLLRLPSRQRRELGVAFHLSETECRALAELLDPQLQVDEPQPSVRIVDADVAEESTSVAAAGDPAGA